MSVAICIATRARPRQLASLLSALDELDPATPAFVVAIADNDAAGSARAVVEAWVPRLAARVLYALEPEANISRARNRTVALAREADAEWLAFIDDDERPHPRWLIELVRVQIETQADVVSGPILAHLPPGAPRWAHRAFGGQRRPRSGAPVLLAQTGNALVARRVVDNAMPEPTAPFEPEFGRSGGGDTRFFLRARIAGATMVWAQDAIVFETIPLARVTVRWIVRRAFREGNAGAFVERGVLPPQRWIPRRLAAATFHLVLGIGLLPVTPIRALRYLAHAAGSCAGTFGYRYFEYV